MTSSSEAKGHYRKSIGGYVVAILLIGLSQAFNKSGMDELIILALGIGAGFIYYPLKRKIAIENETGKALISFTILFVAVAFLVGFLTALI